MGNDVGRNDPCPCGSGQKYKRCCLRKAKQQRGTPSSPKPPSWASRFEEAVQAGRKARGGDAIDAWLKAWTHLREGVSNDAHTIEKAQEELGAGPPYINNWLWDLLNEYRGLLASTDDTDRAQEAADFVAELLDVFDGEPEDTRAQLLAERAYFMGKAGDVADAEALCNALIEDHPERACGYCTLADVYLDADPPRYEEALDVLQRAADEPVEDADAWDLSIRIESVEDSLQQRSYRESEHFIEWSEFWDEFGKADLDEQLEMVRDRIENAPDFDGEWAFQLMIEGVRAACIRKRRGEDWLALLESLREERPEVALDESGFLANSGIGFALEVAPERVDSMVELLFARPAENPDLILRNIELLASKGWSAVRDYLVDDWETIEESGNVQTSDRIAWADWTLLAQMATWADEDIERTRSLAELEQELGPILEEVGMGRPEDYLEPFFGEDRPDAAAMFEDMPSERATTRLIAAFAHDLVVEHDWAAFEALGATTYLDQFVRHCASCEDPFGDRYGTREAGGSRQYRAKLKTIREMWKDDFEFAPHPDLAVGWARAICEQDMLGRAHSSSSFFAAAAQLTPWLDRQDLIEHPELTDAVQQHFALRFPDVVDEFRRRAVFPRLLDDRAEATRDWLEQWVE
ncbi:MAG: SEC-C metal-binding domain-containing protein [Myxococcota bacterium]